MLIARLNVTMKNVKCLFLTLAVRHKFCLFDINLPPPLWEGSKLTPPIDAVSAYLAIVHHAVLLLPSICHFIHALQFSSLMHC